MSWISVPWYLLAGGIGLVILGYFVESLSGPSRSKPRVIHEKMRDKDIARALNQQDAMSPGSMIALLGYVLVGISIVWRLVGYFV